VYPLAWVGLVPLLSRWSLRGPSLAYARELYALLLTTSCCVGFWLLFHPDPATAALGGLSLFVVPVPLVASFALSNWVKARHGTAVGLVSLVLTVLALEFLLLRAPVAVPWLLLGHTQVGAVEFVQMADLGGVPLLTLWVLVLNVAAYLALPRAHRAGEAAAPWYGERGLSIAAFAALVVLPVVYGAVRTAQTDAPAGYTRVGLVQPGLAMEAWDDRDPVARVDYLADLSDGLLRQWAPTADPAGAARAGEAAPALVVWPESALPFMGTEAGERRLYAQLEAWSADRNVALLAGARTAAPGTDRTLGRPDADDLTNSAVLLRPGRSPVRYDQMRRVPFADAAGPAGSGRVLFGSGSTRIAATIGFESLFGDHVRRFALDGAGFLVVLARNDLWGRSSGLYQHLQLTRLRAIETRRSVVLSTMSGVSALIHPSGQIDEVAGWMEQGLTTVDVPTHRAETFYVRHGDWLGRWAVVFALLLHGGLVALRRFFPQTALRLGRRRRLASA
jgi:apolipoprotein N-acyltransferase